MTNFGVGNLVKGRRLIALLGLAALLVLGVAASSPASFSGANGKIFFQEGGDIFSINPGGSEKVDLTPAAGFIGERPSGSADGRHVVFQSYRDGGWNIVSMNADGSSQTDLTNTEEPVVNFEPAFSPDGSKVAFMRQGLTAGEQDIWIMNANGSGQVDLTAGATNNESAPEFSPDGTKIAYIGAGPIPCPCTAEYNNDIWVMNVNGTGQTQLTHTDFPTENISPAWSPDGAKIAYTTNETSGATDNGIHVMDANGANQHRLLPGGNPVLTNNISWSPDGTKIVYEGSGGDILSIMNADGTGSTPLFPGNAASYPSWAPAASGGDTTEEAPPAAGGGAPGAGLPVPTPAKPKALTCKKGFKKKVVKGKAKCVKKHKSHKHKH